MHTEVFVLNDICIGFNLKYSNKKMGDTVTQQSKMLEIVETD